MNLLNETETDQPTSSNLIIRDKFDNNQTNVNVQLVGSMIAVNDNNVRVPVTFEHVDGAVHKLQFSK